MAYNKLTLEEKLLTKAEWQGEDMTANSYFGLLGQATASHHDRAHLANILRRRGRCVAADLSKTYRRTT